MLTLWLCLKNFSKEVSGCMCMHLHQGEEDCGQPDESGGRLGSSRVRPAAAWGQNGQEPVTGRQGKGHQCIGSCSYRKVNPADGCVLLLQIEEVGRQNSFFLSTDF